MSNHIQNQKTRAKILNICVNIARPHAIIACAFYGSHVCGYVDDKSDVDALSVVESPKFRLRIQRKPINGVYASILTVDRKTFEKDIEEDWLGGIIAESIFTPYDPLANSEYLWTQEVKAKKRIVLELLENLVSEHPEMSHEILIKPEYFMFESMMRKASLFPPIAYLFLNILSGNSKERNLERMMKGFKTALETVANEGCITRSAEQIVLTEDCIRTFQKKKPTIVDVFKAAQSGIIRNAQKVLPKIMLSFAENYRLDSSHLGNVNFPETLLFQLEDPEKYLFIPTPLGLVSLSEKATIEDFVRKNVPNAHTLRIDFRKLGGVLNTVYVLEFGRGKETREIVVKVFKDWFGLKWFPLALWALGTRSFTVLGKSRLEKEYAINKFLSSQGIRVPEIMYVSPKERLIFEEFVYGTNLTEIIKQTTSHKTAALDEIMRQVGNEVAKVHCLDVALGDCKPENIIFTPDGEVCFLDLEQAERGGDQAWDVAEFLYYLGHHILLSSAEVARTLAEGFIKGYLEAGGDIRNIEKARSPRYLKVFGLFTPPQHILAISAACAEARKGKDIEK